MLKHTPLLVAIAALAQAQSNLDDGENPRVEISSCQALSCSPPDGSICATGDTPGPEVGIGLASQAINSSSASLSFTLIDGLDENGFTGIGSSEYEFSDQQLFVGMPADADAYPPGCVLMMQYQGQTLSLEPFGAADNDDDNRSGASEGTTSCEGVLNPICRASIVDIIRGFDGDDSTSQCDSLIEHVNTQLRVSSNSCGGEGGWIASFFNVTGGALPRSNSTTASADRLGDDECRPVLPSSNNMFKVAEMRQLYFADPPDESSEFLGRVFGGRTGWTPVMTVIYRDRDDGESSSPDVSFLCMETLARDGEKRESPLDSAGRGLLSDLGMLALAAATMVFVGNL